MAIKQKQPIVEEAQIVTEQTAVQELTQEEIINQEVEKRIAAERKKLADQEIQRTKDRLKPIAEQCKCRDCAALRGELEPKPQNL